MKKLLNVCLVSMALVTGIAGLMMTIMGVGIFRMLYGISICCLALYVFLNELEKVR